jgi:hypothetical protein
LAERSFQAVYYRAADGSERVREYVDALDDRRRAVLPNQLDRLNLQTDAIPHLPFPHSSLRSRGSSESSPRTGSRSSSRSAPGKSSPEPYPEMGISQHFSANPDGLNKSNRSQVARIPKTHNPLDGGSNPPRPIA